MPVKVFATLLLLDCVLVAYTGDFCFRCNGLYGHVRFDSREDQKANANYKEAIRGILPESLSVVDVGCCFFTNDDFGLVFSSPVIETDYFWKCTHAALGQPISDHLDNSKWENAQVIRNFVDDPTADVLYDESRNNGLQKLFDPNAKWIWATVNGSTPAYGHDHQLCVICKGHTKNYVPQEFFGWLSSKSTDGLQLLGVNYREFELAFELQPPSWNSSYCTGARVTMIISPGRSYLIVIFGAEADFVSQLWHCTSHEINLRCIRLAEVSMSPLKCNMFNMVWITIKRNGHFSLGVGRILNRNATILAKLQSGYQTINELRVDHASPQNQTDENHLAKLRIFRSIEDNRCIFHESELDLLQPCGDGYIMDEDLCHECGCCFYPEHHLGRHSTRDDVTCYRPMSSLQHSVHKTDLPSCFRSFRDVVKNVSFTIRPSGKVKLFQNVTFVIAIQNLPRNIRVRLHFGDGLTEENITLAKNALVPGQMPDVYSDFYSGTVMHQYTREAPSGLHDCFPKSCTGYFAALEVIGRDKDRLEVLQFVERADTAPFKAQIFTKAESKNGSVTICAVVREFEVPISLLRASMEFDGSTVNASLKDDLSMPSWLSNHSEPGDYVVILNHVFKQRDVAVIKLHVLLPNAVRYTVETRLQLTKSFQDEICLYDVVTDAGRNASFNLYENITFLLRIQLTTTDVAAGLRFGDGQVLQNVKLSKSISLKDVPEWAVPFARNSSLRKALASHRYTNPGKYAVRLEISDVPNGDAALYNETIVHIKSFIDSLGRVAVITNTSVTINPYDAVTFIVLVENIVGNMMAVLNLDEDSASLYARFLRSTKVEYDGVWYNAVTVAYSFYKPGRHNVTLTMKDGFNSSNLATSVVSTEITVNGIQDAIGEVVLYVDPSKLNLVDANIEFCLLVQRYFRHTRLHATMGDGHIVDFIQVSRGQRLPLWMKMERSKSLYLGGVFSHVFSSTGTYLVEVIAEDALKSRPDYSSALIKVVVQDPLSDITTVPVGTVKNLGVGTDYSPQTDERKFSVSDFTDPSAAVLSSYYVTTSVETSDSVGLSGDTTELGHGLTTALQQFTESDTESMRHSTDSSAIGIFATLETSDSVGLSDDTKEIVHGLTTAHQLSTESDDGAMRHSMGTSMIDEFATVETSDSVGLDGDAKEIGHGLTTTHQQFTKSDDDAMRHSTDSSAIGIFTTVETSDGRVGLSGDTTELIHGLTTTHQQFTESVDDAMTQSTNSSAIGGFATVETSDSVGFSDDTTKLIHGLTTGSQPFTESGDDNAMTQSTNSSMIDGFAAGGSIMDFLTGQNDTIEKPDHVGDSSGNSTEMDFTGSRMHQLSDGSDWNTTGTDEGYTSNFADVTTADTEDELRFKSDVLDKESATASFDQLSTEQGTLLTEKHSIVTGFSVDDCGSTGSNVQSPSIDTDETSELSTSISAVHQNAATDVSQEYPVKEIVTDENAGFPSTVRETRIDPNKSTVTSEPNITVAADLDEDYLSTVTGDAVGTFVSDTATTVDQKETLMPTGSGENVEKQDSTNEKDTVVTRYTVIINTNYEDTVLSASQDFIQTLQYSTAEATITGDAVGKSITGDAVGKSVSGTGTTMGQKQVLLPTGSGEYSEKQETMIDKDTVVARYSTITGGNYEGTVLHESEDIMSTLESSATETATSKSEEKAETSETTSAYVVKTIKDERIFSEKSAEFPLTTPSYIDDEKASEDMSGYERRTQGIVPSNKQDFNVETNRELDVAKATSTYLSGITDVIRPRDSKRTKELDLAKATSTYLSDITDAIRTRDSERTKELDVDKATSTYLSSITDAIRTRDSKRTKEPDVAKAASTYLSGITDAIRTRDSKRTKEPDVAKATSTYLSGITDVIGPRDSKRTKGIQGEDLVTKTVVVGDIETSELTSGNTAKDKNSAVSTGSYTSDDHVYPSGDNIHVVEKYTEKEKEKSSKTSKSVTSDRTRQVTTTHVKKVSDELNFGGKQSTRGTSYRSTKSRIVTGFRSRSPGSGKQTGLFEGETASAAVTVIESNVPDKETLTPSEISTNKLKQTTSGVGKDSDLAETNRSNLDIPGFKSVTHEIRTIELEQTTSSLDKDYVLTETDISKPAIPGFESITHEIGTNKLKQTTSSLDKDYVLTETDISNPDIPGLESITHGLDTKLSTATPKTLSTEITKLKSSSTSRKGTGSPSFHRTSPDISKLESTTSVVGEEMVVGDTSGKPFETTHLDAVRENTSSPHVPRFHVAVYVTPDGTVNFLVLLENTTNNLRGEILFGDGSGKNLTFDQPTSDFPDWLLERPAKDGNFQHAIRTHVYPDSNSTYEVNITVSDDFGNGLRKTVIFKPQSCKVIESVLKVNDRTSKTCFQLHTKDSIYLGIQIPFCSLMKSSRIKWIVSRILQQGNRTEYLAKDILSSPITYDILNYTIQPFTLEVASYMIEAHVNIEDEFRTIVGLSKVNACISLKPIRLQAEAFASKRHYS